MSYPAYPEYADSGIEWIGEIPSGWQVKPAFAVANEQKNSNKGMLETKVLSLSYGNIVERDVESNMGLLPASFETYQVVDPGNIILRLTDLQNDKKSLRVGLVKDRGIITSAYLCLNPKSLDSRFAYYLLHNYDLRKVFYFMGAGVRQSMSFEDLRRLPCVVPSMSEQRTIATFLDRETARIDGLIGKKERLIKLLEEKRQAVISHAVTKGLNPNAAMKDSGIDWLGQIPEHWDVKRLKRLVPTIEQGWSPEAEDRLANENEWGVLKSGCVNYGKFSPEQHKTLPATTPPKMGIAVREGDLLMSRASGSKDLIGSVAIVENCPYNLIMSDKIFRLNVDMNCCDPYFLMQNLRSRSARDQIEQAISGAEGLANNIGKGSIREFILAVPPLDEQRDISNYLKQKITQIEVGKEKLSQAIERLKEHRTSLISAAVTGKIDVRGLDEDGEAA